MDKKEKNTSIKKRTDEEYRKALSKIFESMDSKRLCYYYNYIIVYEKE